MLTLFYGIIKYLNHESYIIISRRFGEKVTFKVDENKQVETYGEKLSRFIDPAWFLVK